MVVSFAADSADFLELDVELVGRGLGGLDGSGGLGLVCCACLVSCLRLICCACLVSCLRLICCACLVSCLRLIVSGCLFSGCLVGGVGFCLVSCFGLFCGLCCRRAAL